MLKHYIEIFHDNDTNEVIEKEITSKDALPSMSKDAFAYRFFDRAETTTGNCEVTMGEKENITPFVYLGGAVYTLGKTECIPNFLKDYMIRHNYQKMIRTSTGCWRALNEGDTIQLLA